MTHSAHYENFVWLVTMLFNAYPHNSKIGLILLKLQLEHIRPKAFLLLFFFNKFVLEVVMIVTVFNMDSCSSDF